MGGEPLTIRDLTADDSGVGSELSMRFLIFPMLIAAVYAGAQIDANPSSASLTFQPFTVGGGGANFKASDPFNPIYHIIGAGGGHQGIAADSQPSCRSAVWQNLHLQSSTSRWRPKKQTDRIKQHDNNRNFP